jgi:diguanylate cyclase (GGDEF)-like protein
MRVSRRGARPGGRLSTRLLVLVLVPLLGVSAFAAWEIQMRTSSAASAANVEGLLKSAARISTVRSDLPQELVPGLARAIVQVPAVSHALGLQSVTLADLGLSDAQVTALRDRTDAAVGSMARDPRTTMLAGAVALGITSMRTQVDSGVAIPTGFARAEQLIAELSSAENRLVTQADQLGLDGNATRAARDLTLTTEVVELAEMELPRIAGTAFPTLAPPGQTDDVIPDWLQTWGGYRSAYTTMLAQGPRPLVDALKAATDTKAAREFDATAAKLAVTPTALTIPGLIKLYKLSQVRGQALTGVLQFAVDRAVSAAEAQRRSAIAELWTIVAIVTGLSLASLLIGWRVLRSVSLPLQNLAASARNVSEGVLDDVAVAGPREVRTVARGLAAAVASLRRIAAQASAVSVGDLDSDVVQHPLPGPLGEVMHTSVETIISAIHERDAAQSDLAYRAAHDPLTELTNRGQAMVMIEAALHRAHRSGSVTGLMFIDLDHFKTVNDTFGHETGDAVLVHCAQRMKDVVRSGDTVARLGGDEFVVLLEDITSGIEIDKLAARIVAALGQPIELGHRQVRVGASVGVAICADASVDAGRLLSDADAAAYEAKKAGRGRHSIFDDELRAELARRAELDKAIADGLALGQFELYYQPVVDLNTGRPQGVEALIRWNRPGHGLVAPGEFIPAAETSRLINDIGRWTLLEATAQLVRWDAETHNPELTVAVNISGRHLINEQLIVDVQDALDASALPPQRLIIEVTETVLVDDPSATRNLTALRELGVRVAIDDFGTGFTSIGQLLSLPVDTLKIDRSFVASPDPAHQELVELMSRAAHTFGLEVVAEGVEEIEQLGNLSRCGVESAQGFHFARPHTAAEARELLRMPYLPAQAVTAG